MEVSTEPALQALLEEIGGGPQAIELDVLLRRHAKPGGGLYSKKAVLAAFDSRVARGASVPCDRRRLLQALRISPTRTHSGVTPVTVFTKPHPCPGTCIFCPSDVRMPKSYTLDERGSHEGARHRFDPFAQTLARLNAYQQMGHPTDKIELLVLGGTWSSYSPDYRRWFVLRCFEALNTFEPDRVSSSSVSEPSLEVSAPPPTARGRYNLVVRRSKQMFVDGVAPWEVLEAAQTQNETAESRCVGLVLETRPDHIDEEELLLLRRFGATKIQLGVQSIRDEILEINRRGHGVEATRQALELLRRAGFKTLVHWMPNLLGSSPQADIEEYAQLFGDTAFRPDELKIYPCVLDQTAELMDEAQQGRWRSYTQGELDQILESCLLATPRYCRIARVMRDLSGPKGGPSGARASRRHYIENALLERGETLRDIRARELRAGASVGELTLESTEYKTSAGQEVFLEWVNEEDRVAGFLRLFLPTDEAFLAELEGAALLRELHVYGRASRLGHRDQDSAQHRGLGAQLIEAAAKRAQEAGYSKFSVISSVGTRVYYRLHGFEDGALYQHRPLVR